jgi:ribosomal protein S18 acetylase RimI-like enzyme
MAIHIRRVVEQDYEVYCDLFFEINELHRLALPGIFQQPAGKIIDKEYFLSLLKDEQVAIFLASQGSEGQTTGFVFVLIRETPSNPLLVPRGYAVVDTLVVRPAFQRTGVGRALMYKAEEWAVRLGVSEVELNVYEFNQGAQTFYERLGYATCRRKMSKKLT